MDGARLQSLIYKKGYGKPAQKIGSPYTFYRIGGTTTGPKYNSGLKYNSGVKYGTGPVSNRGVFDTPGARWESGSFNDSGSGPIGGATYDADGAQWDSGGNWDEAFKSLFTLPVSLNAEDMRYSRPKKYGKALWYALVDGTNLQAGDYFIGAQGTFFIAALQPLLPIMAVECNRVIKIFRPQSQSGTGLGDYGATTADNQTLLAQGRPCSILQGTKGERSDGNLPGDSRAPWWVILLPNNGMNILVSDIITDDLGRRYIVSSPELSSLGWRITAQIAVV